MSNLEEGRPEWMASISGNVNLEDYLLGRKIDKTFELSQEEKAKKAREERAQLLAGNKLKLSADPILELERRRQQLKVEIISNPMKLRQFRERLLKEERLSGNSSRRNDNSTSRRKESKDIDRRKRRSRSGDRCRSRNDDEKYRCLHEDRHRSSHRDKQEHSANSSGRSKDSGKMRDRDRYNDNDDNDRHYRRSRDHRRVDDRRYSESSSSSEESKHGRHKR